MQHHANQSQTTQLHSMCLFPITNHLNLSIKIISTILPLRSAALERHNQRRRPHFQFRANARQRPKNHSYVVSDHLWWSSGLEIRCQLAKNGDFGKISHRWRPLLDSAAQRRPSRMIPHGIKVFQVFVLQLSSNPNLLKNGAKDQLRRKEELNMRSTSKIWVSWNLTGPRKYLKMRLTP